MRIMQIMQIKLAGELEKINSRRKVVEGEMQVTAARIVDEVLNNRVATGNSRGPGEGFCLYDESWHQGITGLVASRIKDKTDEPVIAFADTDKGKLTGSARSVPGLHMRDLLESVSVGCPGLIEKFGGHAMAAGMTIQRSNLDRFSREFHEKVKIHFVDSADVATILTDGELQEEEITLNNAEDIRTAAPWGQGFPVPVFEGLFDVVNVMVVGDLHLKLTLETPGMSKQFQAIAFRALEIGEEAPKMGRIYAVYQMDVNEFRGKRSLQLIVQYWEDREVQ